MSIVSGDERNGTGKHFRTVVDDQQLPGLTAAHRKEVPLAVGIQWLHREKQMARIIQPITKTGSRGFFPRIKPPRMTRTTTKIRSHANTGTLVFAQVDELFSGLQ
ncbi:hypothetical protein [Methanofollis ethanolicus]|uniref:hypothetical protein n=1 Tax=Methanofollis ethanolicus TaxID=488124 RepID=UPI00128FB3C9|nr:hypothetical protein [Methanofollis ethanolicus]